MNVGMKVSNKRTPGHLREAVENLLMRPNSPALILTTFGALLALLHLYTSFFPSGVNWGVHVFAFVSSPVKFGAFLSMMIALIPRVQQAILDLLQSGIERAQRVSISWRILLAGTGIVAVTLMLWYGRQRTFFLGDGLLAMRNLSAISMAEQIPSGYKNAPLPGFILWKLSSFLSAMNIEQGSQLAFQILSIACGVAAVLVVSKLVKYFASTPLDRLLVWLFILVSGGSQLFFGYVETYTMAYLAFLLFAWLSFAYLDAKMHLVFPSIAFGLLIVCHFGMACMGIAMLFLFYQAFIRRRFIGMAISVVAMIGTVVPLLWIGGYTLESFKAIFLDESGSHFVPFTMRTSGWHGYTLFSPWHFIDLANLHSLVSPFSLLIILLLAATVVRKFTARDPQWIFATILGCAGLAFTFFMNFDIGMSRDWDLASLYALGCVLTAAFTWVRGIETEALRRRMLVMIVIVTGLHSAAYVAVNATETASVARYEYLPDDRLWGNGALAYAYEDLWTYYRDRHNNERGSIFAEKCLATDSTNSRRWANGAQIFVNAGYASRGIHAYEKAIQLGEQEAWVFVNLGSEYVKAGRLDEATTLFYKALEQDPNVSMAAFNLGTLLGSYRHQLDEALPYLLRGVETDSTYPSAWKNTGACLFEMGRHKEMIPYFEKFLELAPNDSTAASVRRLLQFYQRSR